MSFLSAFKSVFHAIEAGAQMAAPIIAIVDPPIGQLIMQATKSAVLVEATITDAKKGQAKADLVNAMTSATLDVINNILIEQGKPPISTDVLKQVSAVTAATVSGLNSVALATTGSK